MEEFLSALATSRLCHPDDWPADDEMAAMYDYELNTAYHWMVTSCEFSAVSWTSFTYSSLFTFSGSQTKNKQIIVIL